MKRALLFTLLAALGCQPEMSDMMKDPPMDGEPPDMPVGMPDGAVPFDAEPADADPNALRINHVQMRGTTNSYHVVDHDVNPELLGYNHLPIAEQAEEQGIRFFDFDLVPDRRAGIELEPQVTDDPLDGDANCLSWFLCMRGFSAWLDAHPRHALIVILVGEAWLFGTTPGLHFQLDDLEEDLREGIGRARILIPADVRGGRRTLREAIQLDGWPTVEETRGKVMVVLNDRALARARYIEHGGLDPDERLLFLVGDPDLADDPETGDEVVFTFEPEFDGDPWYFETDPTDLERMEELASAGYLVHGISDDPALIADLRAAGAHFIGTRFPERLGPIPPTGPVACNPVTRPDDCDPAALEPSP